jgi:GAF domain-containing protein
MLPVMDGFGLLGELRADAGTREIPVILLSARAGEQARIEGLKAGADDYLTKPFSARELLARVQAHLELARVRRQSRDSMRESARALEEETRGLETLNQIGMTLASEMDQGNIVQAVTDAATRICGAKFGAFFYNVTGTGGESYQLYRLSGAPREAFEKFGSPRNTPVFDPTFRGEGVLRSDDITEDPRYGRLAPHHGLPEGHLPVRSYLAVPVVSRSGDVLGGLFFGHPERGVFAERDERMVKGLAAQAAVAIDNARLYESEHRARAEAERMSQLKDEFLSTLSHELRTPLSAIVGWAQVIASRRIEPNDLRNAISVIQRNARAQTRLIDDLLDMSRITAGRLRLDVQAVHPARLIEDALEIRRPVLSRAIRSVCSR